MLDALAHFQKVDAGFGLDDFKMYVSLCSELAVSASDADGIIRVGLAEMDEAGRVQMTESGRRLQFDMNLQQKAIKRIKMDGSEADALLSPPTCYRLSRHAEAENNAFLGAGNVGRYVRHQLTSAST